MTSKQESQIENKILKKQEEVNLNQGSKEEETTFQKVFSGLKKLFTGDSRLHCSINTAIVASTYIQCLQLVNIILLFTYFQETNSNTYSIIITTFTIIFFLIDIVPKISQKYYIVFNLVSIGTGIILISFICAFKIIIDNLVNLENICSQLNEYYKSAPQASENRKSLNLAMTIKDETIQMCETIISKFWLQIGIQCFFIVLKIAHFCMYVHAYRFSKQRHEYLERKRRRKQRYNFMIKQKTLWDQNRKV